MRKIFVRTALLFSSAWILVTYQGCGIEPTHEAKLTELGSVGAPLEGLNCDVAKPNVEAILPQRLTRVEYNNVIRDLFGLTKKYSDAFAEDPTGSSGFVTESAAQTVSPKTIEDYWTAALAVTEDAFALAKNPVIGDCATMNDACATTSLQKLTRRAYRRPATKEEVDGLIALYKNAPGTFKEKMKAPVLAILMSPQFIFRTYEIPANNSKDIVQLTNYELASKLSFFIWGSIPDESLLMAAETGTLKNATVLKDQVQRMLKDAKASYLAFNFGRQWIGLADINEIELDTGKFPQWNDSVRNSMRNETTELFKDVFGSDKSVLTLITADYSYIDSNLAKIYGLPGTFSNTLAKTKLPDNRRGLITQASVLTMTSAGDHTLPVVRGKWILDRVLCSAPADPPGNVPPLEEQDTGDFLGESKIRERLAKHRNMGPTCFGCHQAMDPIGLSFENFNSIGGFRDAYVDGVKIDASGSLPTGEAIKDAMDLSLLLENDGRFGSCFARKISMFAQARDLPSNDDKCFAKALGDQTVGKDKKFSDVVLGLITSYEFLNRKVSQ